KFVRTGSRSIGRPKTIFQSGVDAVEQHFPIKNREVWAVNPSEIDQRRWPKEAARRTSIADAGELESPGSCAVCDPNIELAGSIPGIEQNLVVKDHKIGVDTGKKPARVARKSAADPSNFTRTSTRLFPTGQNCQPRRRH